MNKIIIIIIVILVVFGAIFLLQQRSTAPEVPLSETQQDISDQPLDEVVESSDTTSAINQDLESVNVGDLDEDFGDIDLDLDSL